MNYAFVTVLSTNNYYKGVVALFESIKNTNTKYNNFVNTLFLHCNNHR